MAAIKLSSSKKALLFYPGDGSIHSTSVYFVRQLIDQAMKTDVLFLTELRGAIDNGLGNIKQDKDKGGKNKVIKWDELE